MKKVILTLTAILFSFAGAAQNTYNIVTEYLQIDNMVWNETLEKHSFFEKEARHTNKVVWEFSLNSNSTGVVRVTELGDGDKYSFNIYNWELKTNDKNQKFIWIDAIQVSNSEKVTIMVDSNHLKQKIISVFMPDNNLALFFDNMD